MPSYRHRRILILLIAPVVIGLGLALFLFSLLMMQPTGYETLETHAREAKGRIAALKSPRLADGMTTASASLTTGTARLEPVATSRPTGESITFRQMVNKIANPGFENGFAYPYNAAFWLQGFEFAIHCEPNAQLSTLLAGIEKSPGLEGLGKDRQPFGRRGQFTFAGVKQAIDSGEPPYRDWPARAEQIRQLLLESPWTIESGLYQGRNSKNFMANLRLAILVKGAQGEMEAASRMLVRMIEAMRLLHLESYPAGLADWTNCDLRALLVTLAEEPVFPAEALAEADRSLAAMLLDEGAVRDLQVDYALRWEQEIKRALETDEVVPVENTWHFFWDSKPEKLVRTAARPAIERITQRAAAEIAEFGYSPYRNRVRIAVASLLTNSRKINEQFTKDLIFSSDPSFDTLRLNWPILWTRLALAGARHRRDTGRYPATINELVPHYLPAEYLEPMKLDFQADGHWVALAAQDNQGKSLPLMGMLIGPVETHEYWGWYVHWHQTLGVRLPESNSWQAVGDRLSPAQTAMVGVTMMSWSPLQP